MTLAMISPAQAVGTLSAAERRARAADPGTSPEDLLTLAETNANEVLLNPAFELCQVVEPDYLLRLSSRGWLAVLRSRNAPTELLLWASQRIKEVIRRSPRAGWVLAQHPAATRAILDRLDVLPCGELARLHAQSRHADAAPWLSEVAAAALRASESSRMPVDARLVAGMVRAGMFAADDALVHALAAHGPGAVRRCYVAHQRGISDEQARTVLGREVDLFLQQFRGTIRARVDQLFPYERELRSERREFCGVVEPGESVVDLSRSRRVADRCRACMALRGVLPEDRLRALLSDRSWRVRASVAYRPQLELADSLALVTDPDPRVREALAKATSHPAVIDRLSLDPSIHVRLCVARNPRCSPEIDARFADRDAVADCLLAAWKAGTLIDANGRPFVRRDPSDAWGAEECAMLSLRGAHDSLQRVMLLCSPRCPEQVLLDHAASASWWIRLAVARNPRTPRDAVESIAASDWNWVVRAAATEALAAPAEAIARPPLPEPLRADHVSERHMPAAARRNLLQARKKLASGDASAVCAGLDDMLAEPHGRRVLLAGILKGKTGLRASAASEIKRRVDAVHEAEVLGHVAGAILPA